ncbi:hypothetical protein EYZ11_003931 [Aspergillus tanneri]|uniref:Uncharacterized protein n=1 Tax=Aspergillus tanneri TaxID=1220188 RepID=A0A4S3JSP4_9EURO|nr:hypothetical protein EYZ11_003931 [Aspergillus tanneri]
MFANGIRVCSPAAQTAATPFHDEQSATSFRPIDCFPCSRRDGTSPDRSVRSDQTRLRQATVGCTMPKDARAVDTVAEQRDEMIAQ